MTDIALAPDKIDLIKRTVAKNCNNDQFALFLHACHKTGLDPLMKQIYAVVRGGNLAIQTGIDGFRLVADRTGTYAPGPEPTYTYDEHGELVSATAHLKKMTQDGTWHDFSATARYDEYVQRTQSGEPTAFWKKMKHVMTAKVAEVIGLRRGWPQELSGVYSNDEMAQADIEQAGKEKFPRLRDQRAVAAAEEPDDGFIEAGEGDRTVEGDGASEAAGRAVVSDEAAKRKLKLEVVINDCANAAHLKPGVLRDRVKQKIIDDFSKEHFAELTPLEHAKAMLWLERGELVR